MNDFFLFKEAANISPREETEFKYHKIWIDKKKIIFLTDSLGVKKTFSSILQLVGKTCEINFEQQTKTQIFCFQELWWYVVLFIWGGEYI